VPVDLRAPLLPPVAGLWVDSGIGKTRAIREQLAPPVLTEGRNIVIHVPRHRLAGEIIGDFAAAAEPIDAAGYRGRDYVDPDAPGEKMCREQDRITAIGDALGNLAMRACKHGPHECEFYKVCGYQKQQLRRPQLWLVPHQLLFQSRPGFIPPPDLVAIDESFWNAGLRGVEKPIRLALSVLRKYRNVPARTGFGTDEAATIDLQVISTKIAGALAREPLGRVRRALPVEAGVSLDDLAWAALAEWRRKIELKDVEPDTPLPVVKDRCDAIAAHNQEVKLLAKFWELLAQTVDGRDGCSPWLTLHPPGDNGAGPEIWLAWRENIHPSWQAPTIVFDAALRADIVRVFLPQMPEPARISATMPHALVRQAIDRSFSAAMLVPEKWDSAAEQERKRRNIEKLRRFIEVRAAGVRPGRVLVVCLEQLEYELMGRLAVSSNVDLAHFNAVAGENQWNGAAVVIVIGRTEPSPPHRRAHRKGAVRPRCRRSRARRASPRALSARAARDRHARRQRVPGRKPAASRSVRRKYPLVDLRRRTDPGYRPRPRRQPHGRRPGAN
jgi:hypothetical protein